jgi:hypothetical protein
MSISLEEGIQRHRFAGILPEQFLAEAGRHREAVVAADQRMVLRCYRDDLARFVHDVSVPTRATASGSPSWIKRHAPFLVAQSSDSVDLDQPYWQPLDAVSSPKRAIPTVSCLSAVGQRVERKCVWMMGHRTALEPV